MVRKLIMLWFEKFILRRKPIFRLFKSIHGLFHETRIETMREWGKGFIHGLNGILQ